MSDSNLIEKHETFIKELKDYIKDCLKNKATPNTILESFEKLIDETVDEVLQDVTKN